MTQPLCISFIGASGSGKSTCYKFAERYLTQCGYTVRRLDVAYPLRQIQCEIHRILGIESPGDALLPEEYKQDGQLMQYLVARYIGEILDCFKRRFHKIVQEAEHVNLVIVNTDCRRNAVKLLEALARWHYVRLHVDPNILNQRRFDRGDLTLYNTEHSVEEVPLIEDATYIENNSDFADLEIAVVKFLDTII